MTRRTFLLKYLFEQLCKMAERCRFLGNIRGDVYHCSECQPGCRSAATDYQRLDPDAEKGH